MFYLFSCNFVKMSTILNYIMKQLRVALVQMNTGSDLSDNLDQASQLIQKAAAGGANFVLLPEVFNFRGKSPELIAHGESMEGPSVTLVRSLARTHGVWILIGSFCELSDDIAGKVYNTSVLVNPDGKVVSTYRKMHLFEAVVSGKRISEPDTFLPGDTPVLTKVAGISTGMSICFDLRFPELYRGYMKMGAKMCMVPASFTRPTGEAHWETLCRARAIDYRLFVLAPNQVGIGSGGVPSYGNSLVIDPWGRVLVRGDAVSTDVYFADLNFEESGFEINPNLLPG